MEDILLRLTLTVSTLLIWIKIYLEEYIDMRKTKLMAGVLALAMACMAFAGCGGSGKGVTEIKDFGNYVTSLDAIEIPEGTRIVALGEATHGNSEFQDLKADFFKTVSDGTNFNALILEGDFGGCAIVNDYINGGDGDEKELTKLLGYGLYRTDNMMNLIHTMHEMNAGAADSDKVRLYGMDIQRCLSNIEIIKAIYKDAAPDKLDEVSSKLDDLYGTEEWEYDTARIDEIIAYAESLAKDLNDNKETFEAAVGKERFFKASIAADCLKYYIETFETKANDNKYRDNKMQEIVEKILAFEEEEYGSEVVISCHNGHMTKNQSSNFTFLGKDLYDKYGDAYFAVGTDFYNTHVNLPNTDGRIVVDLCSDDPLAYNMKDNELKGGYLDFSKVDEGSDLYKYVYDKIPTGSVGEYYAKGFELMKRNYQINFAPNDMYDAMILYYEVNPTEIWDK